MRHDIFVFLLTPLSLPPFLSLSLISFSLPSADPRPPSPPPTTTEQDRDSRYLPRKVRSKLEVTSRGELKGTLKRLGFRVVL